MSRWVLVAALGAVVPFVVATVLRWRALRRYRSIALGHSDVERHTHTVLGDFSIDIGSVPPPASPEGPPPVSAPPPPPRRRGPRRAGPRFDRSSETGRPDGTAAAAPAPSEPNRYANARLEGDDGRPVDPDAEVRPGSVLALLVGIGPLDPRRQLEDRVPLPEDLLPEGDIDLDVAVVGYGVTVVPDDRRRRPTLTLPGDGGPAVAADESPELRFSVYPEKTPAPFRIRIVYYFRDAVVQSQVVDGVVGVVAGRRGFAMRTDFTASSDLRGLTHIADRSRLSIVANDDPAANHQLTIRPPGGAGGEPAAVQISHEQLDKPLTRLRRGIEAEEHRPTRKARSRDQLVADLRRLAAPGAELYQKLFVQAGDAVFELESGADPLVHVARSSSATFTLPWSFLYRFPLPDTRPEAVATVPVCERVKAWDGRSPLVEEGQRRCADEGLASHKQPVLCPFGFWGFRHRLEILTSGKAVLDEIAVENGAPFVALVAEQGLSADDVQTHLQALSGSVGGQTPGGLALQTVRSLVDAERGLKADIPLVYFLCHGDRPVAGGPDTWLVIGKREQLSPGRFVSWVQQWQLEGLRYWHRIRPLVFVNACHSLEVQPTTMTSYVEAFVGAGNAAGVIGTEASVHRDLAMEFADVFFDRLGRAPTTVGEALLAARSDFLAAGNLFGLVYSPYCWFDLRLRPAA